VILEVGPPRLTIYVNLYSGSDVGPFKAVEESAMAQLMPLDNYSSILAWYYMLGSWSAMAGSLSCGWLLQWLMDRHWGVIDAYRCIFWIYAISGLTKLFLSIILTQECENQITQSPPKQANNCSPLSPCGRNSTSPPPKRRLYQGYDAAT
jgi:MFS-type transporter involved in bile tolerance (Atg22 family)